MAGKILLVGEAPGKGWRPGDRPLLGRIGRRLARLMGVSDAEYRDRTARVNLLPRWPGRASGNGSAWPVKRARAAARRMENAGLFSTPDRVVVLLGRRVATAFGFGAAPWFWWQRLQGSNAWIAVAPHPSGASRWWNEPRNVVRAGTFWREVRRRTAAVLYSRPWRPRTTAST